LTLNIFNRMIFELHQSTAAKKHTSKILPPTYTQNDRVEVLAAAVAVIGVHRRSVASKYRNSWDGMGSGAQFLSATSLRFMLPNMNSCFIIYPTMFNKNEPRFSLRPQAILLSHEKHDFPWWARAWSDIKNIPKDQMYTARFCSDSNPGWNLLCCSPSCIPWRWQKCHRWWSFYCAPVLAECSILINYVPKQKFGILVRDLLFADDIAFTSHSEIALKHQWTVLAFFSDMFWF